MRGGEDSLECAENEEKKNKQVCTKTKCIERLTTKAQKMIRVGTPGNN